MIVSRPKCWNQLQWLCSLTESHFGRTWQRGSWPVISVAGWSTFPSSLKFVMQISRFSVNFQMIWTNSADDAIKMLLTSEEIVQSSSIEFLGKEQIIGYHSWKSRVNMQIRGFLVIFFFKKKKVNSLPRTNSSKIVQLRCLADEFEFPGKRCR